jgi:hypothetical protein
MLAPWKQPFELYARNWPPNSIWSCCNMFKVPQVGVRNQ